jgi:hypothetical protein
MKGNPMVIARSLLLALLAALTALGLLPEELRVLIESHSEAILAGVFALWALVAGLRAAGEAP